MSYRSSYKSSTYRASSTSDGASSSRLRGTSDDADNLSSLQFSTRRTFNYDDTTGPSSLADDFTSSRSSRQSHRLSSRFSTDSDLDVDSSSRFGSKYKSLLSKSPDNDDYSYSRYSRYGSRDESEDSPRNLPPSSSTRVSRYSSLEGDDDYGLSTTTTRRKTRLSYLDEEEGGERSSVSSYSTRRFTSDSLKDNFDDSYKVTTPTTEESRYSFQTGTDSLDDFSSKRRYQSTARSLSRTDSKGTDAGQVYEAILDYEPPRSATDEIYLKEGQEVIVLGKDKPHKWRVRTRRSKNFPKVEEGFAPSAYLKSKNETVDLEISDAPQVADTPKDEAAIQKDLKKKKDMIVRELIETEEDLIRDMQFVQRTYIRQSESSITPKEIKAVKDVIFGCFKEILSFHNDVLLKNFQTLSKEPAKIGAIFLKLEDDFENHTRYSDNLPKALAVLNENSDVSEFFNNYATKIRDEKQLSDHLKLPHQRISDYQLLLKELSKHLSRMNENVGDLEKAIKVIATIHDKGGQTEEEVDEKSDLEALAPAASPIIDEPTDRLGKMLKNVLQAKDYFDVIESSGKAEERFIFLFKTRMFITEINKNISESQRTYNVKKIVKLPEVEVAPDEKNSTVLIIKSKDLSDKSFPIGIKCKSQEQANLWMEYISRAPNVEDKSEQNLIEEDGLFTQTPEPNKLDENNNKVKAAAAAAAAAAAQQNQVGTADLSAATDVSLSSLDASSKTSALADVLDDANTEATTVPTDNLRSESISSVDAADSTKSSTKTNESTARNVAPAGALKIVQPLKAVTKHVGDNAIFECKVNSTNLNVQWLKDNKILSGPNYRTRKSNDTYYLELSPLMPEDAGLYTFVASNLKESTSSSSTLNVLSGLVDSRPTSPGGSFLPHPPKFKVKLKDTELLEGTTVRFELIVRGLPIPNISIFKNNKPLKEDDHLKVLYQSKEVFEIIIEHVRPEDAGVYKCVAINPEGQDETSGKISVSSDKDVFWGLTQEERCTTVTDEFLASPRARSPAFRWFKDGSEFEASQRFQVQFDDQEDNIVLVFQHVKPEDAGIYTCVASTSSGKISCSAELNVQGFVRELSQEPMAPVIKKQLTNINVSQGESVAILEAQVSGYPKPKIIWFKGNDVIQADEHVKMLFEGDENYALVIKNVKDEDAGKYRLEASNELGTADTSAELTVLKKPKFIQVSEKVEVMSNDKLVIEAKYECVPAPKVMWTKDGMPIKDSKLVKIVDEKEASKIVINNATPEDAGAYKCIISNDLGQAESEIAVDVNYAPKFLKKLEAVEIMEDEVAIFTVQCQAVPKAQIEFYKGAKRIVANDRIKIVEDENGQFVLKINNANLDDQGKYKCVAKNKYGVEEDSAELTVKKKQAIPQFSDKLKDIEAKVGDENVKLQVKVDGEPKPVFKWFHNGEEIKDGQKGVSVVNDDKGSALIIAKVAPDDDGAYVCKAENPYGQAQTAANLTVKCPPYVIKHLDNLDASPDSDISLTAIIKGNPTPQIKWFQDEKEIKLDKRKPYNYDEASAEYSLQIKKFVPEDVGMYRIEAQNEYGKCVSSARVDIPAKPLFTKVLKNIVCKEMDSNIEMVVQLDKITAQPLVKWFKDDKEIPDTDKNLKKIHDKLDNSYKLVVLKATEEMVGKYKCVASNDFGSTETAAKFDIIRKPKFIKGLENLQVLEGDHVSMTVQIAGFPKPEIAFYKDGKDVSAEATIVVKKEMDDDIYVLEIENIRIIMSGEYECRIKNEAGEASSRGVVTVNGKPKIVKNLTDVNVNTGEDVALEVVITGNPSPEVKWFVNGKETPGTERLLLDAHDEVFALKIPNATEGDAGVYHCVASNELGKCTSDKCNLTVIKHEFAPIFKKHIEDAIVVVDDNVRFEAQVSASPQAEVTWSKDGVPLKPSEKVLISRDGDKHVLILKDLKLADSGVISCKAQNAKGFNTDTAKLEVHEPTLPTISGLTDLAVVDGEPLKIEATVTGFPKPIVQWYKDGEYVDAQLVHSEPHNDKYLLTFKNFTMDSAGKYTCTAVNSAGEATENFDITISGKKPTFLKELEESIVMTIEKENNRPKVGQSAIFETIVFGIPAPIVTWLKNGKELRPSHRVTITSVDDEHRLEIKDVTREDVAQYTCKAENAYGEAITVCLLKFLNEPHEPIIKKPLEDVKLEEGELLNLVCKVDGEPMPVVKWYKDDSPLDQSDRVKLTSKGDGSTSLTIESPVLDDSGKYEVKAENIKGAASTSGNVLVEKAQRPPKFTKPLVDKIKIEFNCPLILEAQVFGLPPPSIEWIKDGKPINKATSPQVKTFADEKGECKLQIEHAKSDDAGVYAIKATNPNGEALTSSSVQVMPEPFAPLVLENLPVKVQVVKGEPIELHAKVTAYPLPKVTWFKDKKPVGEIEGSQIVNKPDGNLSLTIDAAKMDDAGHYSVTIENTVGEIAISTQVNVLSPSEAQKTRISRALPDKVELVEGKEPLFLAAKIEGTIPKEVTWLKDGQPLKAADNVVTDKNEKGEYSLNIEKPVLADAGVYALVVKSPEGNKLQTQSDVKVAKASGPFEVLECLPKQITIKAGEDLALALKLSSPVNSPDSVKVFKDDKSLSKEDGAKVQILDSGEIKMLQPNSTPADSGLYRIEVKTPDGIITNSCQVQVAKASGPFKVLECLPKQITIKAGEDLALALKLSSPVNSADSVQIFKDDKPLSKEDGTKVQALDSGEIKMLQPNSTPTDSGLYRIEVKTPDGIITNSCQVQVAKASGPFKVLECLPKQITIKSGEDLALALKLSSPVNSADRVQVFKDDKPLSKEDGAKVQTLDSGEIKMLQPNSTPTDSGLYRIEVKTPDGIISNSCQVQVVKASGPFKVLECLPKQITIKAGEDLALALKLSSPVNSPDSVQVFKDDKLLSKEDGAKVQALDSGEIKVLQPSCTAADSGLYRIEVKTPDGIISNSCQVQVAKTSEPFKVLKSLPQQITIKAGEDLALALKLSSPVNSADNVKVFKDDKPLSKEDGAKVQALDSGEIKMLQPNSTAADSGLYRIEVATPGGNISDSCLVQVIDKTDDDAAKKPKKNPNFKKGLLPTEVESGQPCRLECAIEGNPSDFTVSWFKDGEMIVPNEHYGLVKEPNGTLALLIDSFAANDVGEYSVNVKNALGEITSAAKVSLKSDLNKAKPAFVEGLQLSTVQEGAPLILKAKVVSALPLEAKWFRNNQVLTASDEVKFVNLPDGTVMLQIDNTTLEDGGTYKLEVKNASGSTTSEAMVVVKPKETKPVSLVEGLKPVTLIAGEPGFIEMKVDSEADGDIKFLQNGKQVLPNDRVHIQQLPGGLVRLAFDNVQLDDQGEYSAVFQNSDGQVKSSCPVTVKSKPIITKSLTDLTIKEGGSAKFEVEVKGNPEPTISWLKNGLDMSTENKKVTTIDSGNGVYFLVLDKCNLRDQAEYTVRAVNDLGEDTSSGKLSVISSEKFEECSPIFLQPLQSLTIKPGETFTLFAKIKSHPMPEIVWKKDGKEIGRSDKILFTFDGTTAQLTVSSAGAEDFGTYELMVRNVLGEISSSCAVTSVAECAPRFVKKLTDTEASVKVQAKLACRVEGFPEPEITWLFNGKPLESGVKYSIFKELDELILIIFNPTEIDSGTYECQAQNVLGSDKTAASVHFIEKDKKGEAASFLNKLNDYDVLLGGTARFTCCVVGNPRPEIKWFKDGDEIKIDNEKYFVEYKDNGMVRFEVRNVTNADLGKYRCHATNIYGYDNSIAQLNLESTEGLDRMDATHKSKKSQNRALDADDIDFKASGVPVPLPDMPRITKMTDTSLTLIWSPSVPAQPRFPVSYIVEFGQVLNGVWMIYQTGIKDTKCDVAGLEPFEDYSFRIRVENKFGMSDPSPAVTALRSNLKVPHQPKEYKPSDYDLEHKPRENVAAPPKFLREEQSTMFGVCGQPVTLEFWVYGYPEPNITWFYEDQKIEQSSKFKFMHDRNGKVCLFIDKMDLSDVGYYTCVAKNEHGEEKRTIRLINAEPPIFTKRLEEVTVPCRNHVRLDCTFQGSTEGLTVKWFKDYQPLHDTSRISILTDDERSTMTISDCMSRDMGLYSCTVTNIAGSTTTAAYVHISEGEASQSKYTFSYNKPIKPQSKSIEQYYDLGDELGRGTQGITYHAVERSSGKSYAAKMMHGMGEMKQYMMSELDVMNQLGTHPKLVQLRDAFAPTPHSLSLITDMCGGGSLLDFILKKNQLTENEVAHYVRQVLDGLQYMHFKNIGHFGLTVGDLLLERMNGPDLRICDFGLAQRVAPGMKHYVEFGHPEFVSPEIVSKNSVTLTTDTWAVGVVTYILLTGISPFLAENDRATLQNIQNKKLDLSNETLKGISDHGKDFVRKILDYDPTTRLDVKSALNHPWLKLANHPEGGSQLEVLDKLRHYQTRYNKWYENASCRRYYRRRALHSCYTHPSRMIYPPDEQYSPLVSPDREIKKYNKTISPFDNVHPPNAYDSENFLSESHYTAGPDTYLLQLRDTDFPARIRKYLRIAATSSASINYNLKQAHWGGSLMTSFTGHVPQVSIKERRRFTDVMDEEIHDEMRGFANRSKPMRLVRELGTSSYAYSQLSSIRKETRSHHPEDNLNCTLPFFREKLTDATFQSGQDVIFSCYAVGVPDPAYTWFRNDSILIESSRVEVKRASDGRCQLRLKPAREYDVGVYKCVARNSQGSAACRARLTLGDVPDSVSPPCLKDGSANSVLLTWRMPRFVGNAFIKYYRLEYKQVGEDSWKIIDSNIMHEHYLVTDLQPDTSYCFRLSAYNHFGWSAPSAPSEVAKTLSLSENKTIAIPTTMQFVCTPTTVFEDRDDQPIPDIDYSKETNPVPLIKSEFKELYDFKSIIMKGKFSVVARAYVKDGSRSTVACKCVLSQSEIESSTGNEYEMMKSLAHEKIVKLLYANKDSNVFSLAMELLSGLNVLTYLSRKQFYTEDCVSRIVSQVLDALEYLHFRGIALLELQPDNVLVVDDRKLNIKLTDFASARRVSPNEGTKVSITANPEYIAPEVIRNEEVTLPYTDIWSIGVLTYILLSGHSPFKGDDPKETAQNVVYVRYLFDRLYPEVTQEAIRFIITVFKLTPHKRPTIQECHDSKWLLPNEFVIRKRQLATFSAARLGAFTDEFFSEKESQHSRLLDLMGLNE